MDVKEVLDSKNITYKYSNKDYIISCLHPDHEDINPSCHVDKLSGVFHCWSCGDSGNIYERFELESPSLVNAKCKTLMEKIRKLMHSTPLEKPLDYVDFYSDFRGISKDTLRHFEAFTSDDSSLGMEGRIIFPVRDIDGNITNFIGRYLYSELDPKYKYYPDDTSVYLYPEIIEVKTSSIVLVEGIFDLLNLFDKGIKNVVMANGINIGLVKKRAKQESFINLLLKYKYHGIDTINILFDGDNAGRKAAKGLESYINELFNINIIDLDDGLDPGSLNIEQVEEVKRKLI